MRSDWLDAFAVFSEHLNLTRAARELGLSQPALHAQIARLSEAVGETLYTRVGRTLRLTPAGESVALFARTSAQWRTVFLEELRLGQRHSPVILAAGQGAYLYVIGEGIRAFRAQSQTPLQLWTRDREGCLEAVRTGRAHLGVTVHSESLEGFESTPLYTFSPQLAVSVDSPLADLDVVSLADLEGQGLVVPPAGQPWRETVASALRDKEVPWSVSVEASGWPLLLHFVALGMGAAPVNGCCRAPEGVVLVPLTGLPSTTYTVFHREGACEGAVAVLRASLVSEVERASSTF